MPKPRRKSPLDEALEDIASAREILQEVYTPEASRQDLAEAIGKTLEVFEEYEEEEEGEESEDED